MSLMFVAGIYFFARGVFALYGQTTFYTKRVLEHIEPERLPSYLKEIGVWHIVTGVIFTGKAILDVPFPGSRPLLAVFLAALLVCVFFLSRVNEKYTKR